MSTTGPSFALSNASLRRLRPVGFANSDGWVWQVCWRSRFLGDRRRHAEVMAVGCVGELAGDEFDRADVFAAVA